LADSGKFHNSYEKSRQLDVYIGLDDLNDNFRKIIIWIELLVRNGRGG